MYRYLFLFLNLFSLTVLAQQSEFSFRYEGYLFVDKYKSMSNDLQTITFDQRAELKWLISDAKIILRPRLVAYAEVDGASSDSDADFNLTDAFYEQQVTEQTFTTVGLQVYQWGPAELINPSNPFFHFNNNQRSLVYKEKGKVLLRLNWNISENNLVFIVEPVSNNEQHWIVDEKFKPQVAAKFEKSWMSTRNFLGVVIGIPDNADFFIGEYFQYEVFDGLTFYVDSKHTMNTFVYTPQEDMTFLRMLPHQNSKEFSTLAVTGARYEDEFDVRLEYIYNSLGYDQDTFDDVLIATSTLSPYLAENIARFQQTGLELLTQNYLYFSLRKTEPFAIKDLSLYFRSLTSLMDNSGVEQFEFDKSVLDWANVFGQYSVYRGDQNSEFKLLGDWKASLGVKAIY